MANDGGAMFPDPAPDGDGWSGISVRDRFAMEALSSDFCRAALTCETLSGTAVRLYDLAQAMTDEKLRRDKADRDGESEPARHASEEADPSLCGYVSSGAEAVEAIRADAEEVMGTLARGINALDHDEGKPDDKV